MTPAGVIRPTVEFSGSVNQRLPSGPAAIEVRLMSQIGGGSGNSVTTPAGVIRPICPALDSVNQMFPSGPAAMKSGLLAGVGIENSVTTPRVVIRRI